MHKNQDINPSIMAEILSEALPFMRRYNGAIFVVKYGGHVMGDVSRSIEFAKDMVLLKQVGINPVIVHGGGPQIGAMLERLKIKSEFVDGLRVTDEETVNIVEMVLSGTINKNIVQLINQAGGNAIGVSGKDGWLVTAKKALHKKLDPDSNIEKVVDLKFVGEPDEINPSIIKTMIQSNIIPVIAPVAAGLDGKTYNINADTMAGAISSALNADRFFIMTDVEGVLNEQKQLIQSLTVEQAEKLIKDGIAIGGMIPKLLTCIKAINNGAKKAVILDGRLPHSILLEMFTPEGAGTIISS